MSRLGLGLGFRVRVRVRFRFRFRCPSGKCPSGMSPSGTCQSGTCPRSIPMMETGQMWTNIRTKPGISKLWWIYFLSKYGNFDFKMRIGYAKKTSTFFSVLLTVACVNRYS